MMLRLCICIIVGFGLSLSGTTAQKKPQAHKDGLRDIAHKIYRISDEKAFNPAEVSIAINPANPDHVVAVSLQANRETRFSNFSYVSKDGGKTWKATACPNPDMRIQGDDAVVFSPDGRILHGYISFVGIYGKKPTRASNGIFVSSSRDGLSWKKPVPVVDHINTAQPFEDKPYLCVDALPKSPHLGNIYLAWTKFDVYGSKKPEHKSHIYFSRSTDGGKTFSPSMRISQKPGNAIDDSGTVEGTVPAVGPNGEVYVSWAGPEGIVFTKSIDGGRTFAKEKVIAKNPGGWVVEVTGLGRCNGLPVTCVDLSNGPRRGSIYVSWIDTRHGDPDVFVASSRDGGATWAKPVRVNNDGKGNGKEQFFAWTVIDPSDGSVNTAFMDRRASKDATTALTLARSTNGGKTFVNYRIKQKPFITNKKVFFGDYIGIAAYKGRVIAGYMHFVGERELALSAAVFRFVPGTQKAAELK